MLLIAGLAGLVMNVLASSVLAQEPEPVVVDEVRPVAAEESAPVLGRFVSRQEGQVAARISGPVERYFVEVGDRIAKGDLLVTLDSGVKQVQRDQAAAKLAEAQSAVDTARAEQGLASQELSRLERLQGSAAFSQARYEDQRQTVAVAAARVAAEQASVARAEADLTLAELELSYTAVRAPYDGVVLERHSEAGAYVTNGAPLLSMIAESDLEIEADVPFTQIAGLETNARIAIQLPDGTRHHAVVRAIIPSENPLTRTRAVRFVPKLGETEVQIASGQSVTLFLPTGQNGGSALTVHKDAVIPQTGRNLVFIVGEGDLAEPKEVDIGRSLGDRFEVLNGLAQGDLAVVRGNERLRPGQPIAIERHLDESGVGQ